MGTKKGKGGARRRRVLYQIASRVGDGWLTTAIIEEIEHVIDTVPQESQSLSRMGQTDAGGSNRSRQGELFDDQWGVEEEASEEGQDSSWDEDIEEAQASFPSRRATKTPRR